MIPVNKELVEQDVCSKWSLGIFCCFIVIVDQVAISLKCGNSEAPVKIGRGDILDRSARVEIKIQQSPLP